jgi:triosephosphate isomerase
LRQTAKGLAGVAADLAGSIVIAYEPVWAIGTGKTATPEMAAEAHHIIREQVARSLGREIADGMRILYGGSVKPENASALMSQEEIDGALVGGASLDPQSFSKIVLY